MTTFKPGTVTVRAKQGDISGLAPQLTVKDAALTLVEVKPENPEIQLKTQRQFTAIAHYTDGSSSDVTNDADTSWNSDDTTVASINNSDQKGLATGHTAGTALISAAFQGESGSTTLTVKPASLVSISISPASAGVPVGFSRQLTATGFFSDGSTQDITAEVTWSSFNGDAVVNNSGAKGRVTGVSAGTDTISARKDGITGSTDFAVTSASLSSITVTPEDETVASGTVVQYTAMGVFDDSTTLDITTQVTWASSQEFVATISNADGSEGEAQAQFSGQTTISAEHVATGITGSTSLTVTLF